MCTATSPVGWSINVVTGVRFQRMGVQLLSAPWATLSAREMSFTDYPQGD